MIKIIKKISLRLKNRNLFYLLTLDSIAVVNSFFGGIYFRYDFSLPINAYPYFAFENIILLVLLKLFCFRIFGLYRGLWRYTSVWDMFNIIKANIISTILLIIVLDAYNLFNVISRSVVVIDYIICTGLICISRLGIRLFFSHIKDLLKNNNQNIKNIIIIGAGDTGQTIFRQLLQRRNSSMRVVAFLDDNPKKSVSGCMMSQSMGLSKI